MNLSPIVQVKNLEAVYGERVILKNITFEVYPGEIFMIVGTSGCGKTTLLNNMISLIEPVKGEVIIDGKNIVNCSEEVLFEVLKKIGVLYQNGALFGSLDLLGNVKLPLEELTDLPDDAVEEIAMNKLKMVGLGEFCNYMPAEVSGGMQKRAAIARAMVLDPKVLFLDEPTSGLDPIISGELDQLIVNLSKTLGNTFIIISHDLSSIFNIAHRVILLHQGKIIATGSPQELQQHSDPLVKRFFHR